MDDTNDVYPVRSSSGPATFRRTGSVRAILSPEPRSWTTEAGSMLTIAAGGWWVMSPDGDGHGVDAVDFPNLYKRCEGDPEGVYRRHGMVRAVQAVEPGTVNTREGLADYRPGDWIVSNDGENHWPVPDARFRAEHERVSVTTTD